MLMAVANWFTDRIGVLMIVMRIGMIMDMPVDKGLVNMGVGVRFFE